MDKFDSTDNNVSSLHQPPLIAVSYTGSQHREAATVLADKLNLPLHHADLSTGTLSPEIDYLLLVDDQGLAIYACDRSHGPIRIDFSGGKSAHRRQFGGGRGQPLARALGIGKIPVTHVIDATAGFGADAFVMATLGMTVTLLEQSTILAALLDQAIVSSKKDETTAEITDRMQVINTNAIAWLEQKSTAAADVIYLDPMYPVRTKSAQVKKEMQLLHRLIGPDLQGQKLLLTAFGKARRRVVVKRPADAKPLVQDAAHLPQRIEIRSPNTRYDIYSINP